MTSGNGADVDIRPLGPADAAVARAVVREFRGRDVTGSCLEGLLAEPANLLLVAETSGEVIGFVWAHWLDRLGWSRSLGTGVRSWSTGKGTCRRTR
jgi:hypothetical protein